MNVLVVPSGTEIAHEIIRSLKNVKNIQVFGANSVPSYTDLPNTSNKIGIPYINEPDFISSINSVIDEFEITHVFPAHDSAALKLTEHRTSLKATIVSSSYETNRICRSKKRTYEVLENHVRTPKLFERTADLKFPVFAKPDVGQGSVGARVIEDKEELFSLDENDLVSELLPGQEFTIDCVTDSYGKLLYAQARQRCSMRNGIAVETELVRDNVIFFNFAKRINECLDLRGAWFFQVKEDVNGEICLLEVATRIAGSMITSRFNGINFTELSLLISQDIPVQIIDNKLETKLYRNLACQFETSLIYNTIYTDFDDCLLLDDYRVNEELVSLLYRALNDRKRIVLITRHAGNLNNKLNDLRLQNLFDEVIHITDGEPKSKFMLEKNAIFIDDAFSERLDVHSNLGIPCFSVDMVQGLLSAKS